MGEQVIKQVIVALFPTVDGAQQGRELLEAEKKAITLVNTAVITMAADGKVEVDENTGLSARLHGADFPNDQLEALGQSLQVGTSALVATIDIKVLPEIEAKLKGAGATTVSDEMGDEIMGEVIAEEMTERQESAGLDERTRRVRNSARRFSH